MRDIFQRYALGTLFLFCACAQIYLGQPVWSILPAAAGLYILGALLLDLIREGK